MRLSGRAGVVPAPPVRRSPVVMFLVVVLVVTGLSVLCGHSDSTDCNFLY
jgi:hypothetical protein